MRLTTEWSLIDWQKPQELLASPLLPTAGLHEFALSVDEDSDESELTDEFVSSRSRSEESNKSFESYFEEPYRSEASPCRSVEQSPREANTRTPPAVLPGRAVVDWFARRFSQRSTAPTPFARSLHQRPTMAHIPPVAAVKPPTTYKELYESMDDILADDYRADAFGKIDKRLSALFTAWKKEDPAPKRVQPVPLQVLFKAAELVQSSRLTSEEATMDMIWIGFFFLLRPGEHCQTGSSNPLLVQHVGLTVGNRLLNVWECAESELRAATCAALTFPDQKNRRKGESVAQGLTGHPVACPTRALVRRILYLRRNGGSPSSPLCHYRTPKGWALVSSAMVTALLRIACPLCPDLHLKPPDITSRSLRSGGAMALLCGRVDKAVIQLMGRWRSDAMFEYLHAKILPITHDLASTMLSHGSYVIPPDAEGPPEIQDMLTAFPASSFPGVELLDDSDSEEEN